MNLDAMKQSNNKIDEFDKKFIFIICILVLAFVFLIFIVMKIDSEIENNIENIIKKENGICKEYIVSTNKYIYCFTDTSKIKRINNNTKESKYYGKDIFLYEINKYNNEKILYFTSPSDSIYDYSYIYIIDVKTGEQIKVGKYQAYNYYYYFAKDNNLYFSRINSFSSNFAETYIYNHKQNKTSKYSEQIKYIEYAKGNKIYTGGLYYELVGDEFFISEEGIKILIRNQELYIYDIVNDEIIFEKLSLNSEFRYYKLNFYNNENKIFLYAINYKTDLVKLFYIDLNDTNFKINDTLIEFNPINNEYLIDNGYLYFLDEDYKLFKINLENEEKEMIDINNIYGLQAVSNNNIYYYDKINGFSRYNINTKKIENIK